MVKTVSLFSGLTQKGRGGDLTIIIWGWIFRIDTCSCFNIYFLNSSYNFITLLIITLLWIYGGKALLYYKNVFSLYRYVYFIIPSFYFCIWGEKHINNIVWPAYTSFGYWQNFVQKDWVNGISPHSSFAQEYCLMKLLQNQVFFIMCHLVSLSWIYTVLARNYCKQMQFTGFIIWRNCCVQ